MTGFLDIRSFLKIAFMFLLLSHTNNISLVAPCWSSTDVSDSHTKANIEPRTGILLS